MAILDSDALDNIQQTIGNVTGDLWKVPVTFDVLAQPVLGKSEERSAAYMREKYGDEVERVVTVKFEQEAWLAAGGNAVEEGQVATYGGLRFEVKGIVNTGMLVDRFLFIQMDLVR